MSEAMVVVVVDCYSDGRAETGGVTVSGGGLPWTGWPCWSGRPRRQSA